MSKRWDEKEPSRSSRSRHRSRSPSRDRSSYHVRDRTDDRRREHTNSDNTTHTSSRRRRQWDSTVPATISSASASASSSSSSVPARSDLLAIAAKINAKIANRTRDSRSETRSQSPNTPNTDKSSPSPSLNLETKPVATSLVRKHFETVDINDIRNKYLLTKDETQENILKETGAVVTTRGRYYPDRSRATDQAPALHLLVEASTPEILQKGLAKIKEFINQDMGSLVDERRFRRKDQQTETEAGNLQNTDGNEKDEQNWLNSLQHPIATVNNKFGSSPEAASVGSPSGSSRWNSGPRVALLEENIPIGLDKYKPFHVRGYIVGTGGQNVKHIQTETGCKIRVKGRGTGFLERDTGREADVPMYLHITGSDPAKLEEAKNMCRDLITSVAEQIEERWKDKRDRDNTKPGSQYHPQDRNHRDTYSRNQDRSSFRYGGRNDYNDGGNGFQPDGGYVNHDEQRSNNRNDYHSEDHHRNNPLFTQHIKNGINPGFPGVQNPGPRPPPVRNTPAPAQPPPPPPPGAPPASKYHPPPPPPPR